MWEGKLKKSKVVEFSGTENRTNPVYLQSVIPSGSTQTVYPITTSGQAGATAATMQIPASLSQNLIQINGQSFLIPSGTTNLVVGQNNQQNRINQVDGTADDEESGKSSDEDSLHSKPKQVDQKSRKKGSPNHFNKTSPLILITYQQVEKLNWFSSMMEQMIPHPPPTQIHQRSPTRTMKKKSKERKKSHLTQKMTLAKKTLDQCSMLKTSSSVFMTR